MHAALPSTHAPHGAARPTRAPYVLVVDDLPEVRTYVGEVLGMHGYRVTLVDSAEAALDAFEAEAPQVVITDLQMAGLSGRELVQRLKTEHPATVAIVLTGYGTVERTVDLMRIGAFDVLTKPCRTTEILATVEKAIEHHDALWANQDLRKRLRVQEKLAMIGKLAAGVAHELNNPLDATLRCVRMSRERVQGDPEATEYLALAHTGLLRMADIVQSLLTFSRHAAVEQAPQALVSLIDEALCVVTLALGEAAPDFDREVTPEVAPMPVPRGFHQVLVNLVRNACDAAGPEHPVRVRARRVDDELRIDVVDRGPGIPADVLARVFEPFFTTKEPGRGTGLGLPISARLVEKFGGAIQMDCPAEGGTVVTVTLPMERDAVPQEVVDR